MLTTKSQIRGVIVIQTVRSFLVGLFGDLPASIVILRAVRRRLDKNDRTANDRPRLLSGRALSWETQIHFAPIANRGHPMVQPNGIYVELYSQDVQARMKPYGVSILNELRKLPGM